MSVPSAAAFEALARELASARAAEAATALENVRLATEAREASRYQAATAEVLQVINSSVSDPQAVYDKILETCERLLDVDAIGAWTAEADGMVHTRGLRGTPAVIEKLAPIWPLPVANSIYAATVAERRVLNVPSFQLMETRPEAAERVYQVLGDMSGLSVPMIVDGRLAGTLGAMRIPPRPFSDRDAALLQGFADQAAIAIQNARLFNETQTAQKHQAALGDVMRAMSESPNDAGPVFDVLLDRAIEISGAAGGFISRFDGEQLHPVARRGLSPEQDATYLASPWSKPHQPGRGSLQGRAVLECQATQATDIEREADFSDVRPFTGHIRSGIAFPLLREGRPIGAFSLGFAVVGSVADDTARLLQRFAEQAAIAIHNAQLFKDTQEALDRQTATAEVLQVISKSPTDIQPVFDAIAARAAALCHAGIGTTAIFDGKLIHMVAVAGASPAQESAINGHFPRPADDTSFNGRAVLSRLTVHIADTIDEVSHPERDRVAQSGVRSLIAVPMMRGDEVFGVIAVTRDHPGLFSDPQVQLLQTFAAQAVIAIENARLFRETREALERQTATSEVLRVISSSITDTRPVFEKILDSCQILFGVEDVAITQLHEDGLLHLGAGRGVVMDAASKLLPRPLEGTATARAIHERRPIHTPDLSATAESYAPFFHSITELIGNSSGLIAPLLLDGIGIGSIWLARVPPKPFSDQEIALLTTFADQAVIAIENARLFRETQEALEHQTATAEVLQVISSSPSSTLPVFQAIAERARLVSGYDVCVLNSYDGEFLHIEAAVGFLDEQFRVVRERVGHAKPTRGTTAGRAILTNQSINVADFRSDPEFEFPQIARIYRSGVCVLLVRHGQPVGTLSLVRRIPGAASDKVIRLLETFAEQAVIAIENVRLFNETREALEQQTATSEVLRVISSSIADTRPVFEKILDSCQALFGVDDIAIALVHDDAQLHVAAMRGAVSERIAHVLPRPVEETAAGRAILERRAIHYPDTMALGEALPPSFQALMGLVGSMSSLTAPLLLEGRGIGGIGLIRTPVKPFSIKEIALLTTFADQAVIAIENARLFRETREALEQQTATADVLQVISTSVADAQPVYEKILDSAVSLIDGDIHVLHEEQGGQVHVAAYRGGELAQRLSDVYPIPLDQTSHSLYDHTAPTIYIANTGALKNPPRSLRLGTDAIGPTSFITARLSWEGEWIGSLTVLRTPPRPFSDRERASLRTFADQAVIAFRNARLFNDTREALEQQTATAEVLKVISSSVADAQPVFEKILDSCQALFGVGEIVITRLDDAGQLHLSARRGMMTEIASKTMPAPVEESWTAQAILGRRTIHMPNAAEMLETLPNNVRAVYDLIGNFSAIVAPLLRDGLGVGSIGLWRVPPKPFSDKEIALLTTFADQAVIAIENARLFRETQEALKLQTASSQILQVISTSMADARPVYETILERGADFLDANLIGIFVEREGEIHNVGFRGDALGEAMIRHAWPTPVKQSTSPRIFAEQRVINIENVGVGLAERPLTQQRCHEIVGDYSNLIAPMFWEGRITGAICAFRYPPRPFSEKEANSLAGFAEQAAIAIQNARLFNDTKEALEQQTSTAEVLQVMSTSMADAQPVFERILDSAEKLIDGDFHVLFRVEDGQVHVVASRGEEAAQRFTSAFPVPVGETITRRAGEGASTTHIPDSSSLVDPPISVQRAMQVIGAFAAITAPLHWEGQWIGSLTVGRVPPRPFGDKERALLRTFADQAVIAFQNAQLFNDTKEALEQQTAISDVLRVTTESPSVVEPVLNAIAEHAVRLCDASAASIFLVEDDQLRHVCSRGPMAEQAVDLELVPIDRGSMSGMAILEGIPTAVADIQAEAAKYPLGAETARRLGHRSMAVTPLLREGKSFGTLLIRRHEVRPFSERELNLLQTFGSQAAIALENVRLFKETKEALEQQTATAEVLRVISSSVADTQPVFEKILDSCTRIFDAENMAILLAREDEFHLAAYRGPQFEALKAIFPSPIADSIGGVVLRERRVVHDPSVAQNLSRDGSGHRNARRLYEMVGDYSRAMAPLLWEGRGIGTIGIMRHPPRPFTDKELTLLATFADQAVIAIENARLFHEIEDKSRQLEEASQHKSQFLASMSHELRTPLNAILGFNEMILDEIYGEVPSEMLEPLRDIQDSGKHLLRLINNVLDLAKIEAGRMELALSEYAVHDLLESVRAALWPLAASKGLDLRTTLPEEVPLAYGDSGRLTQCLMNLVGNALKFTAAGSVEISLELRGGWLCFRVADTGIGIPADKLDGLFTEFKQTDSTIASEFGGTGLGLAISRKFVEMHGGRIWVESELGQGSVFSFEVPLTAERRDL